MKRKNDEILRMETIINNDRLRLKDEFSKLLEKDLFDLLQEYFYLDEIPQVEILKNGKGYEVKINFSCSNIKSFINVPN